MASSDSTSTAKPILEMDSVTVLRPDGSDGEVLDGVTWTVRDGDYWAIGGRQGAGKTELLSVAAGLSRPASGSVNLFGRDIVELEAEEWIHERLRLGFVFSDGGRVFHHLSVAQNVSLPLCYHYDSEPEDVQPEVDRVLNAVELTQFYDEYPAEISPAWRQRIGLARALAMKPDVLLLDNPTSGLDFAHSEWWLNFLGGLAKGSASSGGKRVTLVVATSSLSPWLNRATQFAFLKDKQMHVVGDRAAWDASPDPLVREMAN